MQPEDYVADGGPRIAVDFDGVIYPGGQFKHAHTMDLPPNPGAISWITQLIHDGFQVLIFTSRMCIENHAHFDNSTKDNTRLVEDFKSYFAVHGMLERDVEELVIYPAELGKPACWLFVDDHAYRFTGYFPSPEHVRAMHKDMYYKQPGRRG